MSGYLNYSGNHSLSSQTTTFFFAVHDAQVVAGNWAIPVNIHDPPPWMSEGSDFPPGKWNLTTHPQETLVCRKYPWKQSENVYLPPRKWGEQEKTLWTFNFPLDYLPHGNIFSSNTPWKFLQALSCPLEMLKYPPSPRKRFTLPPEISFIHGGIISE